MTSTVCSDTTSAATVDQVERRTATAAAAGVNRCQIAVGRRCANASAHWNDRARAQPDTISATHDEATMTMRIASTKS